MTKASFLEQTMPHQAIIYKVVNVYADNKEDKEDLLQEIWVQLWLSFPRFRAESKTSTWMYRVALNTALTYSRRSANRNKHLRGASTDPLIQDNNDNIHHEQERLLWDSIRTLQKSEKALILLYIDGISYREIAEITGDSESNVGVKLTRIRQKLKELITGVKLPK